MTHAGSSKRSVEPSPTLSDKLRGLLYIKTREDGQRRRIEEEKRGDATGLTRNVRLSFALLDVSESPPIMGLEKIEKEGVDDRNATGKEEKRSKRETHLGDELEAQNPNPNERRTRSALDRSLQVE